jgi:formate/nitrite transporter FocA (FNT family)
MTRKGKNLLEILILLGLVFLLIVMIKESNTNFHIINLLVLILNSFCVGLQLVIVINQELNNETNRPSRDL